MTDQSKFAESYKHILELNNARQKKWYDLNGRETKRVKRQADRKELKDLRALLAGRNANVAPEQPSRAPQQEARAPQQVVIRRRRQGVAYAAEEVVPPVVIAPKEVIIKRPKAKLTVDDVVKELEKPDIGFDSEGSRKIVIADVRTVFKFTGCEYFEQCVKNFKKLKAAIETARIPKGKNKGKLYSANSKKSYFCSIRWAYDLLKLNIPANIRKEYETVIDVYKVISKQQTRDNKTDFVASVLPQDVYIGKIKHTFGVDSKEWLISQIYFQCPCRDNLDLTVVPSLATAKKDKTKNYIIVPRKGGRCKIVLNQYKTAAKYLDLDYDLDESLSALVQTHNIEMESTLFHESSLSAFISKMNAKIGVKGGVNYLRHLIISNQDVENLTPEQLVKEARKAGHSADMHLAYARLIAQS